MLIHTGLSVCGLANGESGYVSVQQRGTSHLDLSLGVEVVVPQDDLVVLPPSGEQGPVPHLTQSEEAPLVCLHLAADVIRACGRRMGAVSGR